MTTAYAAAATEHLKTIAQSIAGIPPSNIWVVNNDADLSEKAKSGNLPALGIMYEGIRSTGTDQKGIACDLVCSYMLLTGAPKLLPGVNSRPQALVLLDAMRHAVLGQRAPMGHFWKFTVEAPVAVLKEQLIWVQRWTTSVMITTNLPS